MGMNIHSFISTTPQSKKAIYTDVYWREITFSAVSLCLVICTTILSETLVAAQGATNEPSPCDSNPCVSTDASCFVSEDLNHYICTCPDGSNNCQFVPCDSNPCQNGGGCFSSADHSQFICNCIDPWTGPTCETGPTITTQKQPVVTVFVPVTSTPVGSTTHKQHDVSTEDEQSTVSPNKFTSTTEEQSSPSHSSKGPVEKEEWTFYGLTKIDLLSIVLPTVVAIPSAILTMVKIYFKCKNRGREPGGNNNDDDGGRRGSTTAVFWKTFRKSSPKDKTEKKPSRSLSLPSCNKVGDISGVSLEVYR